MDANNNLMPSYASKRSLKTVAEEMGLSIHKLRRMIRVLRKEGPDGIACLKWGRGGDRGNCEISGEEIDWLISTKTLRE